MSSFDSGDASNNDGEPAMVDRLPTASLEGHRDLAHPRAYMQRGQTPMPLYLTNRSLDPLRGHRNLAHPRAYMQRGQTPIPLFIPVREDLTRMTALPLHDMTYVNQPSSTGDRLRWWMID